MTADPNNEALERLRSLKHEFNAFAQLQYKQIEVLEGLSQYMGDRDDSDSTSFFIDAPPGDDLLSESLNKLKVQNKNVHELYDLSVELNREVSVFEDIP